MEINLELLIEYIEKLGVIATVNIDIEDHNNPMLIIQRGKYQDNGGVKVFLEFNDMNDILKENHIMEKIRQEKIHAEKYIYEALSKYIIQMLHASNGEIFFPEIKPLEKHYKFFPVKDL